MQKSLVKFAVLASLLGIGFLAVWQGKDKLGLSFSGESESITLDDFVDEVPAGQSETPLEQPENQFVEKTETTTSSDDNSDPFGVASANLASSTFTEANTTTDSNVEVDTSDPFNFGNAASESTTVNAATETVDPFAAFAEAPVRTVSNETVNSEAAKSEVFDPFAVAAADQGDATVDSGNEPVSPMIEVAPELEKATEIEADPFSFGQDFAAENTGQATTTTTTATTTTTEEMVTIKKSKQATLEAPALVADGTNEETAEKSPADLLFAPEDSTAEATTDAAPSFNFAADVASSEEAPSLLLPEAKVQKTELTTTAKTESTDAAELMVIEPPVGSVGRFPTIHAPNTTEPAPISLITDRVPAPMEPAASNNTEVSATSKSLKNEAAPRFPTPGFPEEENAAQLFPGNSTTTQTTTQTVTTETQSSRSTSTTLFPGEVETPQFTEREVKNSSETVDSSSALMTTAIKETDKVETTTVTPVNRELAGDGVVRNGVPRVVNKPEITLEKKAPQTAVLGQPMVYSIIVKNVGNVAAKEVLIEDRIPLGSKLTGTIPRAQLVDKKLMWRFPSLDPNAQKTIKVRVIPTAEGEIGSVTTVAFKTEVAAETQVTSPRLDLVMNAPEQVVAGEEVAVNFRIKNSGKGDAMNVILHSILPKQLKHPAGNDLEYEIGTLKSGQTRDVTLRLVAEEAGLVKGAATVRASGGITANDEIKLDIIDTVFKLTRSGPARRFVGMNAVYTLNVQNESVRDIATVTLREKVPAGMEFVQATGGGEFDPTSRTVSWKMPTLKKQSKEIVKLTLKPTTVGTLTSQVEVTDARGHKAELSADTKVEGFASLRVDVSEGKGLVEVGERLSLRFSIRNRGSAQASNVIFQCKIPEGLQFVKANGITEYDFSAKDNLVTFKPVAALSAGQSLSYDLVMSATKTAETKLNIAVAADEMHAPLAHDEHVVIYNGKD